MSYELIITEKPSAALKMAYSLADTKPVKKSNGASYYLLSHNKKDIVIVSAVGHLFGVAEKKNTKGYPVFEIDWKPTYEINNKSSYSKKYALNIKKLAEDAESFTVACDYDIEGEVIGINCIKFLCKQKDANRMKFSTLTKPDLISAYENKANTINWGQANAGETRHFLDWLYGINISRALTSAIKKSGENKTLSSGRVQGPALKLIVDREKEILNFKPTPYWQLELDGKIKDETISAFHEKDQFSKESEVDKILKKTKGKDGFVKNVEKNEKIIIPPYAFDLTTLQTEAYKNLGISPKQALSIAQNLYLAGVISYPRTSSQKLPPTIGYSKILSAIQSNNDYTIICSEILSKEKIYPRQGLKDDPAHPAIFPTGNQPKNPKSEEKKIYDLIVRRFLSAFGEPAKRMETIISIDVEKELFIAKGIITIEKGWYNYYGKYSKIEDKTLPEAKNNEIVRVKEIIKHKKETTPPRRFSPASIIKELEKRNLGTKSTRAQIIDTLYQRGFIKGNQLEATTMGIRIIETLSNHIPKIIDEELTRQIEEEMQLIRENKSTKEKVLQDVKKVLKEVLENFKKEEKEIGEELVLAQKETVEVESLGSCPNCDDGQLLIKRGKFGRFIACNKYPDCKTTYNIPNSGFIEASKNICPACKVPSVFVKFKGRKKQEMCINTNCPTKKSENEEVEERSCPECKKGTLKLRTSMYGKFYGCSNYPKCKHTEKINDKK
ncbi:MAG: DNA topoisomerase I [Nanoarchaeota archaeon]|nr:DNA topoisomerase I [Nanoarchaeota archaeon]